MKKQSLYDIEHWAEHSQTWSKLTSFTSMRKSFADGAWAMLRAHSYPSCRHRLTRDGLPISWIEKQPTP